MPLLPSWLIEFSRRCSKFVGGCRRRCPPVRLWQFFLFECPQLYLHIGPRLAQCWRFAIASCSGFGPRLRLPDIISPLSTCSLGSPDSSVLHEFVTSDSLIPP